MNGVYRLYIGILLLLVATAMVDGKAKSIMLKSAFYHPGAAIGSTHLELGNMVLFFSDSVSPLILHKKELVDNMIEQRMLFPQVVFYDEQVQRMVERLKAQKTEGYTIKVAMVKVPVEGLEVVITYQKEQVQFYYDTLVSPAALPGYIFRFINYTLYTELSKKVESKTITHTAALKKKRPCIVIDPGHGGDDTGAIGVRQLQEKMVTLNISKKIKHYLRRSGCDILLTRATDVFLTLDARTAVANGVGADLFVSVHANAALNKDAAGIETFFYPHDEGKKGGAIHSGKEDFFFTDYFKKKTGKSVLLAESIQQSLCAEVYPLHTLKHKLDRKVKKAPFQVLIGSCQPGVLVEVGFLTHPYEGELLMLEAYQKRLAQGIAKGILTYLHHDSSLV